MEVLELSGIRKSYGECEVLRGISFRVREGERLSILGPSGCGKTTLLRILMGLEAPDAGSIRKRGAEISDLPPGRRSMGIVFQNYALFENMTVEENISYAMKFHAIPKGEARERAEEMLEATGLLEHRGKLPRELSGGQQQRVAIARTLVLRPDIVLLDEPMSALDIGTALAMRQELKKLQRRFGAALVYVTHDQEEAFALSDRIMVMADGAIQQVDTPEAILKKPENDFIRSFVLDNLKAKIESLSRFSMEGP